MDKKRKKKSGQKLDNIDRRYDTKRDMQTKKLEQNREIQKEREEYEKCKKSLRTRTPKGKISEHEVRSKPRDPISGILSQ